MDVENFKWSRALKVKLVVAFATIVISIRHLELPLWYATPKPYFGP